MSDPIKVLVAEDQERMRKTMVALLSSKIDIIVVGEATNGEEATAMAKELLPDVILMDIRMPICDGIDTTALIKSQCPKISVLILTTYDDADLVVRALHAGASGYVLKDTPSAQIAKAIQTVFEGNVFLGQKSASRVVEQLSRPKSTELKYSQEQKEAITRRLSVRETEILKLIGEGKSNSEISQAVHMSEGTVRNYVSRIFWKIDARDRIQAVLLAKDLL